MRKLAFFTAIILTISCSKISSTKLDSESPEVYVEDGILVFKNFNVFSSTLKKVNSFTDIEKDTWEKQIGFISFRTTFNSINSELENETNLASFNRTVTKFSRILKVENEEIKPMVNAYFSSIVNPEGIVRIQNDYYRFYQDYETIVLNGSIDKVKKASEAKTESKEQGVYSYKTNWNSRPVILNRYTCTPGILSECTSSNGSNRRGYHKLEFNYYLGIERDPVTSLPTYHVEENSITLHFSAQKKVLFVWGEYATSYLCKTLDYSDYDFSGSTNISTINLGSGGDFKHWYYSWNYKQYKTPYGQAYVTHTCTPEITLFSCRATTGGTSPNDCLFTW